MVNLGVDAYTKTPNKWKISEKCKKDDNLLKTKRILNSKYKLRGVMFIAFSWPGESKSPLIPAVNPVTPLQQTL